MKIIDLIKSDYFLLFVKREGKVVLGKSYSNLWLLTAVLSATFLAIAFSNASLDYLSYKMDDPFINWVDIKNEYGEGDFYGLEYALDLDENKERYHYYDYQADHSYTYMFFGQEEHNIQYLKCRFFQNLNTSLVEAILSKDNVVKNWKVDNISDVNPNTIGVIITEEVMKKMGYDSAPSFIDYMSYAPGADALGFDLLEDEFARLPVPVLAVVKRLPGNVDMISTSYFYQQACNDNTYPFNMCNPDYAGNLTYFIPADLKMDRFRKIVEEVGVQYTESELEIDEYSFYSPELIPFRDGQFVIVNCFDDYLDYEELKSINEKILDELADDGLYRVYSYAFSDYPLTQKAFLSVHFEDLDMIRDFESYVRDTFKVRIEMSQINAKENFNAVSAMGNILSWVIIVFAIVCIVLFIVNLLQSYFQEVKRNLGTFKAFGISDKALISVYVIILTAIMLVAIIVSITVTWLAEGCLHLCGVLKDGVFDYLSLWSIKTGCSIIIIIFASTYTVYFVMSRLLKSTPGDLIYDR